MFFKPDKTEKKIINGTSKEIEGQQWKVGQDRTESRRRRKRDFPHFPLFQASDSQMFVRFCTYMLIRRIHRGKMRLENNSIYQRITYFSLKL